MCVSIILLYDCSNVVSNGSWGNILAAKHFGYFAYCVALGLLTICMQ